MFKFLKKIFSKNKNQLNYLGKTKINYNLKQWIEKIQKNISIDSELLNELEILFIKLDIGIDTSNYLISKIKKKIEEQKIKESSLLLPLIKEIILLFYQKKNVNIKNNNIVSYEKKPKLFLFVGINGVGKTTTIGKLATKFKKENKKILLLAGDNFRAGAIEQLKKWGEQTKSEIFTSNEDNIKTSKLFFNALKYAEQKKFDVILCDTSGRLQNKINLMKELEKIEKVIQKHFVNKYDYKKFLVIDALTGQNALNQVNLFHKAISLNDIIMTKLDNISRGGIILSIKHLYNLNTKYIGIGEKNNDLIDFNIQDYIDNYLFKI
jgi:fused signal recognition particle receptor